MKNDASFHVRMPRETLERIEKSCEKMPYYLSKNSWFLKIIHESLDKEEVKNGTKKK